MRREYYFTQPQQKDTLTSICYYVAIWQQYSLMLWECVGILFDQFTLYGKFLADL